MPRVIVKKKLREGISIFILRNTCPFSYNNLPYLIYNTFFPDKSKPKKKEKTEKKKRDQKNDVKNNKS